MLTTLRVYTLELVGHRWFLWSVILVIIANSITLGLETYPAVMRTYGDLLHRIDTWFLAFFVAELALKLFALGARDFARQPWNLFDVVIVLASLPFVPGNFSALRALRILRLFNVIPAFRYVVEALLRAARGAGAVFGIITALLYVFSVTSNQLFGLIMTEQFGNLQLSAITHFELMIGESWGDVARTLLVEVGPWTTMYLVLYTLIVGFILVSMLVGVIVEANQGLTNEQLQQQLDMRLQAMQDELTRQNTELLKQTIQRP